MEIISVFFSVLSMSGRGIPDGDKCEQGECDESVEEENFEAEVIAKPLIAVHFEDVAYCWRGNGYQGYPAVAGAAVGE